MIVAQHNDNTVAARVTPSGHGGGGAGRNPSNTTFTNNSSNNAAVDRHLLAYHLRDVPRALHNIQSLLDKAQKYVPKPIDNNPVDVMSEHKNDSGGKGESSGTAVSKKGVPSRSALPLQNAKKPVVASSNKNPSRPPGGLIPSKNVPPAAAAQARRVAAAASSTTATSATANRAVVGGVKSSSVKLSFQRSLSLPFSVNAPGAKSSSINQAQDGQTLKSNHVLLLQAYQRSATSISPAPHMTPSPSPATVALQYYPDVADNAMITTTATTAHRLFDTTSVDDTTRGGAPRVTNRQHRAVQIPPSAGSLSSIPPARAGFGPATTMGTTKSWLTKTHAKGFLSSVLGIPQQQQQLPSTTVSLQQISGAGTAAAPPSTTTQGESTTSLTTSSSSSLTLLQRIQQELANAPGRSGGLNTSVATSSLAYGRSMSLNSTAYTAPHLSTSDTLSRSASINTHLQRRHYTQDTIFERLSSIGTEAHPLPTTSSTTLNHHTHQQQQAYSRTVSSASLGGCPAAVPPSSVAPAVSAAPADALWVGGLRPKTSKPAGAARPMVAPLRGATIPAAPPSSIWGRLYGLAEKKIAQQQQQAAVEATTAAALQNQKSKSAAANLNHHNSSATVHQSVSAVVHRLYEKDIKQKEQQRAKKQQERELAEQQRLKRERDEIFNRAAKFREQAGAHFFLNQSTTAAPSTTTTHPMAIPTIPVAVDDALRPFSRQHSASRVHRDPAANLIQTGGSQYQLIPSSGSYHKAATSTSGHAFDEDTDVEEEVVATHGADDAQSFVLTPYGTWHRKNSGAGGSGPVAASSSNNRSPLPLIVSATGGVGRSVVSPIDAKKSSRMAHIPHSRTSSYVSASSPAPPAVATTSTTTVGVVDGGREELLDSRLSTMPPSRSGSVPPNPLQAPNLSQSTSNIAPLAAAPRPLRLDEDVEEDDQPQPPQPADKSERPHRPPKVSKLDFSKLRKSKQ